MSNLEDYPVLSKWLDNNAWSEENSELVVTAHIVEEKLLTMQAEIDTLEGRLKKANSLFDEVTESVCGTEHL
jgi:hypothetical protein